MAPSLPCHWDHHFLKSPRSFLLLSQVGELLSHISSLLTVTFWGTLCVFEVLIMVFLDCWLIYLFIYLLLLYPLHFFFLYLLFQYWFFTYPCSTLSLLNAVEFYPYWWNSSISSVSTYVPKSLSLDQRLFRFCLNTQKNIHLNMQQIPQIQQKLKKASSVSPIPHVLPTGCLWLLPVAWVSKFCLLKKISLFFPLCTIIMSLG